MNQDNAKQLGFWAALLASILCILFGANVVALKISLQGTGVFTTALIRFTIAAIIIFFWAKLTKRNFYIAPEARKYLVIIGIGFSLQLSLFTLGVNLTSATLATLLVNMQPFFILILANFLIPDDRFTWKKITGILFGLSGVFIIFSDQLHALFSSASITELPNIRLGDLLVFFATLIWSTNTVFSKKVIHHFLPFHLVFYPMILSLPIFFLLAILFDKPMVRFFDITMGISFFYQGVITASLGFVLWNTLLKKYGAVALHAYAFIIPVSGVLFSYLLLKEDLKRNFLLSLLFIVAGILIIHVKPRRISVFPFRRGGI